MKLHNQNLKINLKQFGKFFSSIQKLFVPSPKKKTTDNSREWSGLLIE
jgi:hypothetical protein